MTNSRELPDDSIPPRILRWIQASTSWEQQPRSGNLVLGGHENWYPLNVGASLVPEVAGVYAFALDRQLAYPAGTSTVVYIGSTKDLKHRLLTHKHRSHNDMIRRILVGDIYSLSATWLAVPSLPPAWLTALESEAIAEFINAFGTCPCFNYGRPDSKYEDRCSGLIKLREPPAARPPIALPEFAPTLGMSCTVTTSAMGPFTLSMQMGAQGQQLSCGVPIIRFTTLSIAIDATIAPSAQELNGAVSLDEHQLISSRFVPEIYQEHCAEWSADKMAQLQKIARTLSRGDSEEGQAIYAAVDSDLPDTCTWGEVALILGRLVAGTWFPNKRLCVTIHAAHRVIGYADLHKHMILGFDLLKRDEPAPDRQSFWTRWEQSQLPPKWQERIETTTDKDGIKHSVTVIEEIQVRASAKDNQNAARAAMDRAIEDAFEEAQRALEGGEPHASR
jgi:hypothetical protein